MGQKVNPHGLRVGIVKGWDTQWYADKKDFAAFIKEDYEIRKFIKKNYYDAAIAKIAIERAANKVVITIHTAKPGVLIGKQGIAIEELKKKVAKIAVGKTVAMNVVEVKKPDADSQLIAENVALQLEKRIGFKRAVSQVISRAMRTGIKGIKVMVSGRLNGAEIARSATYHEGALPLQTLRADIDYGFAEAHTTFGVIGIKVWVYKGEILGAPKKTVVEGGEA